MTVRSLASFTLAVCLAGGTAHAQLSVNVQDISPDQSTLDASNPNGSSGGRVNGLAVDRSTAGRLYAASEWGGLFRSDDNGVRWRHLDGHVPTATWDVEVDPTNSNRVYATSFYDGRAASRSGINVSTDAGVTWTHPASATPPAKFCANTARQTELAAFGIAIDPANANRVFIGTNCGLARSTDAGATWTFLDPTPATGATNVWDVLVHNGGIVDVCGDDGHLRSTDGGVTWTTSATQPLQSGRCSLAVSPDEAYVLFAVVGTSIFETDDAGQTWSGTYANPAAQGRIPFIATNQRAGNTYDLWFADTQLFRGTCTTPNPPAQGGAQRCNGSGGWVNSQNGSHWDGADIAFAPGAATDACPLLFSNDGGVYRNTLAASPGCHTPTWDQPTVTPHALWNYTFSGSPRGGAAAEDLYFGNQDNGTFGTTNGGAAAVAWNNQRCCDGFDTAGEATRGLTTVCCSTSGRATRLRLTGAGLTGAETEVNTYPAGNMRSFEHLNSVLNFGADDYVVATTQGVFVTLDIGANPIVWTELGAASSPATPCGVQVAFAAGTPTFFVKNGGCDGDAAGTLWRYQGTAGTGTWQQVTNPGVGSFGVYAVDRNNPQRLIASHLGGATGPRMVRSLDGGTTWSPLPALDARMTGGGVFRYQNTTGPGVFTGFGGYPQPTLVAFDPADSDIVVAGAADAGVFISTNGGTRWQLVTDPFTPGTSGTPHIPRPLYAHFDHDGAGGAINLYLGTRGRGAWRLTFTKVAMAEIQVPSPPAFPPACVGETVRATMQVCNASAGDLFVTSIASSNPEFSVTPPLGGFPVTVGANSCFPVEVAFTPVAPGTRTGTLTIASNDPSFPSLAVPVSATVGQPTAVTVVADTGNFGEVCSADGLFKDLDLTVNNSGSCPLLISAISSSSPEFQMAQVLAFPLKVAPGASIAVPIRFQPTSPGSKSAALTLTTNDPAALAKVVKLSGEAPPEYVCHPPVFAALDGAIGPTWGTGRTGNYTFGAAGRVLAPFGNEKTFGVQAQSEYAFYRRRQEGQADATLLYRREEVQFAATASVKRTHLRAEAEAGALSQVTLGVDFFLLPNLRFGVFGAKGLRERDVVTVSESLLLPVGGVQPILATERLVHTVDQLGGAIQAALSANVWIDGHLAWLHRHAPGVGDTVGAAARVNASVAPGVVLFGEFNINESFLGANTVGTVLFGATFGKWPRPADLANPLNPLGTFVPRLRYELFERVR